MFHHLALASHLIVFLKTKCSSNENLSRITSATMKSKKIQNKMSKVRMGRQAS